MKTKIEYADNNYNFYNLTNGTTRRIYCDCCHSNNISSEYERIITSLQKAGVLPPNYPYICCGCWNTYGMLGRLTCEECGSLIYFSVCQITENLYRVDINCSSMRCPNYKRHKLVGTYKNDIRELFEYDPQELVTRWLNED